MKNQTTPTSEEMKAKMLAKYGKSNFSPLNWLKENREWIIEDALEEHPKSELVAVMTAVKNAVMACSSEHKAYAEVASVILTHNFSMSDFMEQQHQALEARKRTHLG